MFLDKLKKRNKIAAGVRHGQLDFDPSKLDESGERRWLKILLITIVATLFGVAWNGYVYSGVVLDIQSLMSGPENTENATINKNSLDKVLGVYEDKKAEFDRILEDKTRVMDPSR